MTFEDVIECYERIHKLYDFITLEDIFDYLCSFEVVTCKENEMYFDGYLNTIQVVFKYMCKDCVMCINCRHCIGCIRCNSCENLVNCIDCASCTKSDSLIRCWNCHKCSECEDSKTCTQCYKMIKCDNCEYSADFKNSVCVRFKNTKNIKCPHLDNPDEYKLTMKSANTLLQKNKDMRRKLDQFAKFVEDTHKMVDEIQIKTIG